MTPLIADSIRSEAYRLSRNRMAVFWSVGFVPVLFLALGFVANLVMKAKSEELTAKVPELNMPPGPLDLGLELVRGVANLANPIVLLFVLIGVATLYAGDYRWETWRLITARNSRLNLLLGKVVVAAGLTVVGLAAWMIAGVIGDVIKAAVFERPLAFTFGGDEAGRLGLAALLTWARVMQFTMMALLAAVVTRSLLAALFVPLAVAIGQFFLMQFMGVVSLEPGDWIAQLLMPGLAADMLKALIQGGPAAATAPDGVAIKAVTSLALWLLWPLAAALAWFQRQDLSKE